MTIVDTEELDLSLEDNFNYTCSCKTKECLLYIFMIGKRFFQKRLFPVYHQKTMDKSLLHDDFVLFNKKSESPISKVLEITINSN